MPPLTNGQKAVLRRASREGIEELFQQLDRIIPSGRWLFGSNRYRANSVRAIRRDTQPGRSIRSRHLADYIAVSAPLHCADGWSILGRALNCHSHGNADAARHLGYYAELRAAVAILAGEGIGIFSNRHFAVDSTLVCHGLPGKRGTHDITWLALEHWADLQRSGELLSTIICPAGVPLKDWALEFGGAATSSIIATEWLKTWGLDLQRLSDDRDARNEASYRPTRLNLPTSLATLETARFLQDLWSMYEPQPQSRFDTLDRHLLRLGLERIYHATTARTPAQDPAGYRTRIDSTLTALLPNTPGIPELRRFLTRQAAPATAPLLLAATGKSRVGDPKHHTEVLSRAALLLRIASGVSARLLALANIDRAASEFWWRPLGEDRGLWPSGGAPDDFTELWADIASSLTELQVWDTANATTHPALTQWILERAREISYCAEGERPALWGLGL